MMTIKEVAERGSGKAAEYVQARTVPCQGDPDGYWQDYYLQIGRKLAFDEILAVEEEPPVTTKKSKKKKTEDK